MFGWLAVGRVSWAMQGTLCHLASGEQGLVSVLAKAWTFEVWFIQEMGSF